MENQKMSTITQRVTVGRDRHIRIELDVPADFPEGEAEATVDLKPVKSKAERGVAALAGIFRGKVRMADDFDAPLDDFADYR
jgi:hypothetical protein